MIAIMIWNEREEVLLVSKVPFEFVPHKLFFTSKTMERQVRLKIGATLHSPLPPTLPPFPLLALLSSLSSLSSEVCNLQQQQQQQQSSS
jgi:hypothetical protein